MTRFTVLVADPEPRSAIRAAAAHAAQALARAVGPLAPGGEDRTDVVDLAQLGPALLAARPGRDIVEAVETVRRSDVLLVASPQAHGSYTGLLKVFLDRLPELGLGHGVAAPMAVVEDLRNGRTIEDDLRVLLADLGAWVAEPGLLMSRRELAEPTEVAGAWAEVAAPALADALSVRA
ncbi:NADPH-dependent FMN reductase [Streptomonospora wellingtoniae]|uniref:NAD(P)H-dependent oxidoreductase n=1 Tax=Streptomonospora wellingtoniae TaxID=3075544 RepID=A0ABU2KQU1_9ACTN|nr:NAD(P)H-dependent oxidoreductase [Streptomonospora sp. DSM 45055]MDT0301640.1 NAD(P)H-dependent oxidoreductase [Streptomonospora sp. DSM 45055]